MHTKGNKRKQNRNYLKSNYLVQHNSEYHHYCTNYEPTF